MNEIVFNFSVLQPTTLQNLNDTDLLEKALVFVDLLIITNHFISSSFPEVCTAFLLFLTIPVTTASAERSFSKLKLIQTYLKNSIVQERLRNLAILSIEHSKARNLNCDDAINTFAE